MFSWAGVRGGASFQKEGPPRYLPVILSPFTPHIRTACPWCWKGSVLSGAVLLIEHRDEVPGRAEEMACPPSPPPGGITSSSRLGFWAERARFPQKARRSRQGFLPRKVPVFLDNQLVKVPPAQRPHFLHRRVCRSPGTRLTPTSRLALCFAKSRSPGRTPQCCGRNPASPCRPPTENTLNRPGCPPVGPEGDKPRRISVSGMQGPAAPRRRPGHSRYCRRPRPSW